MKPQLPQRPLLDEPFQQSVWQNRSSGKRQAPQHHKQRVPSGSERKSRCTGKGIAESASWTYHPLSARSTPGSTATPPGSGRRRRASVATTCWFRPRSRIGLTRASSSCSGPRMNPNRLCETAAPWRRACPAAGVLLTATSLITSAHLTRRKRITLSEEPLGDHPEISSQIPGKTEAQIWPVPCFL